MDIYSKAIGYINTQNEVCSIQIVEHLGRGSFSADRSSYLIGKLLEADYICLDRIEERKYGKRFFACKVYRRKSTIPTSTVQEFGKNLSVLIIKAELNSKKGVLVNKDGKSVITFKQGEVLPATFHTKELALQKLSKIKEKTKDNPNLLFSVVRYYNNTSIFL